MEIATRRALLGCWLVVGISILAGRPLLAQRAWHQGDMWLKWSHEARESYVLGYLEGSMADQAQAGDEHGAGAQPSVTDTGQMVKSVTEFYTRYPGDRDIYIREVIEQLRKGLTFEQVHNYPFWRHQAPKAKP